MVAAVLQLVKASFFSCETSCNHSALAYWGREIWAWNVGSQKTLQKVMKNWTDWKDIQLFRQIFDEKRRKLHWTCSCFSITKVGTRGEGFWLYVWTPKLILGKRLEGYNLIPHPPVLHELPGKLFAPVLEHWHHRSNLHSWCWKPGIKEQATVGMF